MFKLPATFLSEGEKYITNLSLKVFIRKNRDNNSGLNINRPDLINEVYEFANKSADNEKIVLQWVDKTAKEGIKDVHIKKIKKDIQFQRACKTDKQFLDDKLAVHLFNTANRHLCGNEFTNKLELVDYQYGENKLSLIFCEKIYVWDRKSSEHTVIYPVFVDVYIDKMIIAGRSKSKSGMYPFSESGLDIDQLPQSLTAEKLINNAIALTTKWLDIEVDDSMDANKEMKNKLFELLDTYTHTPDEIQELLKEQIESVENIVETIVNNIDVSINCDREDIKGDVLNIFEKYFSISYPDKRIFTKGNAYPLKILATDDEESKVEQTAADEEPLQTKAVFYDNKKMLHKSRLCDGIIFCYNRIDPKYANGKTFQVRLNVKKGTCIMKFMEYVREEDIENVLFSIINAE